MLMNYMVTEWKGGFRSKVKVVVNLSCKWLTAIDHSEFDMEKNSLFLTMIVS